MKKISFGALIALAVVFGVAAGLFGGERCRSLAFIGQAFIAIMQISVLPYIFVSLIQSFGSLDAGNAKKLAKRGTLLILMLWTTVFLLMSLMPLTFPGWHSESFFSPSLLKSTAGVDYIQLFIPANPFSSLANNMVPAVTIFSILCGVVLMGMKQKQQMLELLDTTSEVLTRLTTLLVKLSPIGIFALIANAAGTMHMEDIGRMEVYLTSFLVMGALLFFVILPLAMASFTPFTYREFMSVSQTTMITVLLTGNMFIVLPLLVENVETLYRQHNSLTPERSSFAKIMVPILFILPCAGQLMDIIFIQFAGWFSSETFGFGRSLQLYSTGLLTLFGSPKVAIPFLLGMFHLPEDLFDVYVISSVITDNIRFTVESCAVLSMTLLFTAWMTGGIVWKPVRFWKNTAFASAVVFIVLFADRWIMEHILPEPKSQRSVLNAMKIADPLPFTVFEQLPEAAPGKTSPVSGAYASRYDRIIRTGVLRVGFNSNAIPFAFFNDRKELVGFDISMAHRLGHDIGCRKLEFYPVSYEHLDAALNAGQIDIIMSHVSISGDRLGKLGLTNCYLELSLALIVPDYLKVDLEKNPQTINSRRFTIAALEGADYNRLAVSPFRCRKIKIVNENEFFSGKSRADALICCAENGASMAILHPEYDLFFPQWQFKDLIAYAVPLGDQRFLDYLNFWLTLKRSNGEIEAEYNYWIRGINVEEQAPRWCILDNVIRNRPARSSTGKGKQRTGR